VDDCITSLEGFREILSVVRIETQQAGAFDRLGIAFVLSARDEDHFMPA